jgi:hypothetical protein
MRLRSRRACRPAIPARLTLKDQPALQDVHDHRNGLLTVGTNQSGFVNGVHAKGRECTRCTTKVLQGFL